MKVLIFSVILFAAQAGVQGIGKKNVDCALVRCPAQEPPVCPPDTVLTRRTPRPEDCCNLYECNKEVIDCSTVKCLLPPRCPAGTVPTERRKIVSAGDCCNPFECEPEVVDCSRVMCLLPPRCPEGTVLNPNKRRKIISSAGCCNPFECEPVCYTQWFDRDDPSGTGDHETLKELRKEYPGKICTKPLNIQAMTLSGVPAENTEQVFRTYDTVSGFACLNSQQTTGCLDYKVRFGCPCLE